MSSIIDLTNEEHTDGFDLRIVNYEEIHNIRQEDFDNLITLLNVQPTDIVLDAGCGYGAITREILYSKRKFAKIYLIDISPKQINRAFEELSNLVDADSLKKHLRFIHDSIVHLTCRSNFFDKVVSKMVVHEIPKRLQQEAINEFYRTLKPGGTVLIWDLMLSSKTQYFFQKIIQQKDILAGYKYLANNRYFIREEEWFNYLNNASFSNIKKEFDVVYEFSSKNRLQSEFKNDISKLVKWNDYIRKQAALLDDNTLELLQYKDEGNSISFVPPKAILSAIK